MAWLLKVPSEFQRDWCRTRRRPAGAIDGDLQAVLRPVFHPAERHQVELDDITQQLRDLPLRELDEDAERARLRAARRELAGLPASPWTEHVPVLDRPGSWSPTGRSGSRRTRRSAGDGCATRRSRCAWPGLPW